MGDYRTVSSESAKSRFGKCGHFVPEGGDSEPNVPSECIDNGGRTGYSVKMVSKDYLKSDKHRVGSNRGEILNPPP